MKPRKIRWFSRSHVACKCRSCWDTKSYSNCWSFSRSTGFLQPSPLGAWAAQAQCRHQYWRWDRAHELYAPWGITGSDPGRAHTGASPPTCTELQSCGGELRFWAITHLQQLKTPEPWRGTMDFFTPSSHLLVLLLPLAAPDPVFSLLKPLTLKDQWAEGYTHSQKNKSHGTDLQWYVKKYNMEPLKLESEAIHVHCCKTVFSIYYWVRKADYEILCKAQLHF